MVNDLQITKSKSFVVVFGSPPKFPYKFTAFFRRSSNWIRFGEIKERKSMTMYTNHRPAGLSALHISEIKPQVVAPTDLNLIQYW